MRVTWCLCTCPVAKTPYPQGQDTETCGQSFIAHYFSEIKRQKPFKYSPLPTPMSQKEVPFVEIFYHTYLNLLILYHRMCIFYLQIHMSRRYHAYFAFIVSGRFLQLPKENDLSWNMLDSQYEKYSFFFFFFVSGSRRHG